MTGTHVEYTTDNTNAHELAEARLRACGAERFERADDGAWLVFGSASHPLPVRLLVADAEGWPVSLDDACPISEASGEVGFWILIDPTPAATYVVPEWWIRHDIDELRTARLVCVSANGTSEPAPTPVVDRLRVERWRDRWDLIEKLLK